MAGKRRPGLLGYLLSGVAGAILSASSGSGSPAAQTPPEAPPHVKLAQSLDRVQDIPPPRQVWSLANRPSQKDLTHFEAKAVTGESMEDLARYQEALVAFHFPQALTATGQRYTVLYDQDYSQPPSGDNSISRIPEGISQTYKYQVKLEQDEAGDTTSLRKKDGSFSPYYSRDGRFVFGSMVLSGESCTACHDRLSGITDCKTISPDDTRRLQVNRIKASEHETGHFLSHLTGYHKQLEKIGGKDTLWTRHAEENIVTTYSALRLYQLLGPEAHALLDIEQHAQMLDLKTDGDTRHVAHRSLANVRSWVMANGNQARYMSPPELFEQATRLTAPYSPEVFKKYIAPFEKAENRTPQAIEKMIKRHGAAKDFPDELLDLQHGIVEAALNADFNFQARLNPLRGPALAKNDYEQWNPKDPAQLVDMARFNDARQPSFCPPFTQQVQQELASFERERRAMPAATPANHPSPGK